MTGRSELMLKNIFIEEITQSLDHTWIVHGSSIKWQEIVSLVVCLVKEFL
jgi:hypothetical protein